MTYELREFVDHPDVQARLQALAERLANELVADRCLTAPAAYHEHVEDEIVEAVESTLNAFVVDSFEEWEGVAA